MRLAGKEVGLGYEIDIDWEEYDACVKDGSLFFYGAYVDGVKVGYLSLIFITNMFRKGYVDALVDSVYVTKDFRNTQIAWRLLNQAIDDAKREGAKDFVVQCPIGSSIHKALAKRGFSASDQVLTKSIGE